MNGDSVKVLEVRCNYRELVEVIEDLLGRERSRLRSVYGDGRVTVYRLGMLKRLVVEYDRYSRLAIISCNDGPLLKVLHGVLLKRFGSSNVTLRESLYSAKPSGSTDELLRAAVERNSLLRKARYSRRFLAMYMGFSVVVLCLSAIVGTGIALALLFIAILAVLPHDKWGPARFFARPEEVFIPILYPLYRRRYRVLDQRIRERLPLLPRELRRMVEQVLEV